MTSSQLMVAVFGGAAAIPGDGSYEMAVDAGKLLAEAGFVVATGGYGGVMEAAASGAAAVGGDTVGITAPSVFLGRAGANSHIAAEVQADSLTERIHYLIDRSAGFLVLPGSIGTLTELVVAWNSAFVTRYSGQNAKPVVTVGQPWLSLVPQLADLLRTDATLVSCHKDLATAVGDLASQLA